MVAMLGETVSVFDPVIVNVPPVSVSEFVIARGALKVAFAPPPVRATVKLPRGLAPALLANGTVPKSPAPFTDRLAAVSGIKPEPAAAGLNVPISPPRVKVLPLSVSVLGERPPT